MNKQEITDIVDDITILTEKELVKWNPTSTDGEYTIKIGDGTFTIDRCFDTANEHYDYDVNIFNKSGDSIYRIMTNYDDREDEFLLQRLYKAAENSFLQRDSTIKSIKDAIKKINEDNLPF